MHLLAASKLWSAWQPERAVAFAVEDVEKDSQGASGGGVADGQVQDAEHSVGNLSMDKTRLDGQELRVEGRGGLVGGDRVVWCEGLATHGSAKAHRSRAPVHSARWLVPR